MYHGLVSTPGLRGAFELMRFFTGFAARIYNHNQVPGQEWVDLRCLQERDHQPRLPSERASNGWEHISGNWMAMATSYRSISSIIQVESASNSRRVPLLNIRQLS